MHGLLNIKFVNTKQAKESRPSNLKAKKQWSYTSSPPSRLRGLNTDKLILPPSITLTKYPERLA